MNEDELTISDVIADEQKDFRKIFSNIVEENGAQEMPFHDHDSLYYTETEFVDFISSRQFKNGQNLTILSMNIANLMTKLRSLKLFLSSINTPENIPDIISVVETHISRFSNTGYTEAELRSILPGYCF